jgi:anti-sigma regulatory factor (Ser/Thr protein kinase)
MTSLASSWTITPTAEGLAEASRDLGTWLARQGAPEAGIGRVELVLEEVVMNLIMHGTTKVGPLRIQLDAAALPEACQLRILDNCLAFDPTTATPRPDGAALEQATPGGLGLVLLRRYATDLAYAQVPIGNLLQVTVPYAAPAYISPLPPMGTLR